MRLFVYIIVSVMCLLALSSGYAQTMYEPNDSLVFHWEPTFDSIPYRPLERFDASMDSIDNKYIQPRNWLDNLHHKRLPYKKYDFADQEWNSHYDHYALDQLGYFYSRIPYVSAFYSLGSQQTQTLRLLHTQNISKNFNYAARFNRDQSLGFIRRDNVNENNVSFSLHAEMNKYRIRAKGVYFTKKTDESAGLTSPGRLANLPMEQIPVRLNSAEKMHKGVGGSFLQRYFLNDTTGLGFYLFSKHELYSNFTSYKESGTSVTNFYDNVYFDSSETLFSQKWNMTSHYIGVGQQFKKLSWSASTYFTYEEFDQSELSVIQRNFWAQGSVESDLGALRINANGRLNYLGDQAGNFDVKGGIAYKDSNYFAALKLDIERLAPYLKYRYMNANNFQWQNNLPAQQTLWLRIQQKFWGEKLNVSLGWTAQKNQVYFTSAAAEFTPQVENGTANFLYANIGTHLQFWKIHWEANVKGQYSQTPQIFNYPVLDASTRFYFDGLVFKSQKLRIQTGFEAQYFSPAENVGYMPFLEKFYYNPTGPNIGNALFLDYFLNFKVSSVDVFVKVYNWNVGWLTKTATFVADNYPINPFHFRVGFRWQFLK